MGKSSRETIESQCFPIWFTKFPVKTVLLFTSDKPNGTSNLRIKEHQRAIQFRRPEKSALCQHSTEMITSLIGLKSKFKKWNMITRSVFLLKVGTSMKSPKCSIQKMGYHFVLLIECCLIPSAKFLLV